MGSTDQLDTTFGNRPCCRSLGFRPDLIDDDHFGHVILHCLDHHVMLEVRLGNLHAASVAQGRMGDVTVAGDLV